MVSSELTFDLTLSFDFFRVSASSAIFLLLLLSFSSSFFFSCWTEPLSALIHQDRCHSSLSGGCDICDAKAKAHQRIKEPVSKGLEHHDNRNGHRNVDVRTQISG
jgi:hypothetical protein